MKRDDVFESLYFVMCDFIDEFGDDVKDKIRDDRGLMDEMINFLCEKFEENFDFKGRHFFED